jgi:hypothetical protein
MAKISHEIHREIENFTSTTLKDVYKGRKKERKTGQLPLSRMDSR